MEKGIADFIRCQQKNTGNWSGTLTQVCTSSINTANGIFEGVLLKHPDVEEYCVAEWFTDHSGHTSPAGAMYKQSLGVTPETFVEYCQRSALDWT